MMCQDTKFKELYLLVEGNDDSRFFKGRIKSILERKYRLVRIQKWAEIKKERVSRILKTIIENGDDYIFFTDFDSGPCYTKKKEEKNNIYTNLNPEKIIIIKKEIESWYLAVINERNCNKLGITNFNRTDNLNKNTLKKILPENLDKKQLMINIMIYFSINEGKNKNESFKYFVIKYLE